MSDKEEFEDDEGKLVPKVKPVRQDSSFKGAGSWGIVYFLSFLLLWTITNHTSERVVLWLVTIVSLMWLIKLFEKKISGEYDLDMLRISNGKQ